METQRVQLEISNDIFDKVMFFLENLPKNQVTLNVENSHKNISKKEDIFSQTVGILSSRKIDPIAWQNQIRNEWD